MVENRVILRGGYESVLYIYLILYPYLKKTIVKIGHEILSWKHKWEKHKHFLSLQNYIYKYFRKYQLVGCYNTQDFQLQLKDALTPFLPATTRRNLRLPTDFYCLPLRLPTTLRQLYVLCFMYTL